MNNDDKEAEKPDKDATTVLDVLLSPVVSTHPHPNVTTSKTIDFNSINEILSKVFKHDGFRSEMQREAVTLACKSNRDLFVSLPTGSGKSLIYQLPAVYKNQGLVIVVSPLLALMSNQITNARKLGIPCATINSHNALSLNKQIKEEIKRRDTRLRLLYVTPETLCSDHFQPYLNLMNKNKTLKLFAIDEAHCVSDWGHDFRHDYLKLGQLRSLYPEVAILALTATATNKVLQDILNILHLRDPKRLVASSFRKNLYYDVVTIDKHDDSVMQNLKNFLKHCLSLKLPKKEENISKKKNSFRAPGNSFKKATTLLTNNGSHKLSKNGTSNGSAASAGGQFVSAAVLLTSEKEKQPSKAFVKRTPKRNIKGAAVSVASSAEPILAKEAARITSFFKTKPVEMIDLCNSDEDDRPAEDSRKATESPEDDGDDVVVVRDDSRGTKRLKKEPSPPSPVVEEIEEEEDLLTPAVHEKPKGLEHSGVGIIYCRTKAICDEVAAVLEKSGIPARPYHSDLKKADRAQIEKDWMEERILVICATISFGMGIDKPNVRVVVHLNMSQSLANYYQESGRAGRDGLKANCRLYYAQSDESTINFILRKEMDESRNGGGYGGGGEEGGSRSIRSTMSADRRKQTAQAALDRFQGMVNYCNSTNKCRHLLLAKEFSLAEDAGVLASKGRCGESCDYCYRSSSASSAANGNCSNGRQRRPGRPF